MQIAKVMVSTVSYNLMLMAILMLHYFTKHYISSANSSEIMRVYKISHPKHLEAINRK